MQSINETRQRFLTDIELELYQFYNLNEKQLLRGQLGLNYDSFIDALKANPQNKMWTQVITPGAKRPTLLDPFIGLNYRGVNYTNSAFRQELTAYPFTFFKEGESYDPDDPSVFENAKMSGATFSDMLIDYPLAIFEDMQKVDFTNSEVRHYLFHRPVFKNGSITNCYFIDGDFNDRYHESPSDHFNNIGKIEIVYIIDSKFDYCNAYNVWWNNNVFEGTKFKALDARFELDQDGFFDNFIENCEFYDCLINIHAVTGRKMYDNAFESVTFPKMDSGRNNVIDTYCMENDFIGCVFHDLEIGGTFQNNAINRSTFANSPNFKSNADIRGTDFSNTNLDDYFTKQQVKNAVNNWDSNTIWVDGTPF